MGLRRIGRGERILNLRPRGPELKDPTRKD
jgi:hypothetical protein